MIDKIKKLSKLYLPDTIKFRRHIHQNPELSFLEKKTAQYISAELSKIGIEHKCNIATNGIAALISGKNPLKKVVMLRADTDALPITEETNAEYTSINNGIMHACGHDAHSATLLSVAKILFELKDAFEGSFKLIFQPGEEKFPGGASLMINEGILNNPTVDVAIAQHVFPELETGHVGFRSGTYMASADEIRMTVKGKGGHAAMPHTLIDPIAIAAQIIVSLQQLISRTSNPSIPSVLSFGKIIGNGTTNVIPNEVQLEGTFRTFDESWRAIAHKKITDIARNTAQAFGAEINILIDKGYPVLKNEEKLTEFCKKSAIEYLGENFVHDLPIRTTAEDFSYFSQIVDSCFYRFGTGNKLLNTNFPVHNSQFNIDEQSLETSVGLMTYLAIKSIEQN
jgi:amidohydrolase